MNRILSLAGVLLTLSAGPGLAQMPMAPGGTPDLPPICLANAVQPAQPSPMKMGNGDGAHEALMAGMDQMDADMLAGSTATDADVAFVCAMIPHHRGAITMARAELQYGDDPWAKRLAEGIIAAQEKEIAGMLDWLGKQ